MLEVRTPSGRVALVPFVRPILIRVEADARRLILDPPAGLMDL